MLRHVLAVLVLAGFMMVVTSGCGEADKKTVMPTANAPKPGTPPGGADGKARPKQD
jgi:hypothetical protein